MRWFGRGWKGAVLGVVALGLGAASSGVAVPGRAAPAEQPTKITVTMTNYKFTPDKLTLKVGERVELTLVNKSEDKTHEFLMGRDVKKSKDKFGKLYSDGFKTSLIDSRAAVTFGEGETIEELQADLPASAALEKRGGSLTMEFTVPNKPGKWLYGCFQENGSHWDDHHMKGEIDIVR